MASVRKAKGGGYQARWRERGAGGKPLHRARNFATRQAAKDFANRMAMVEAAAVGDAERLTVAAYLDRFVQNLELEGERSPVTVKVYGKCVALIARELGHIALTRLSPSHIDDAYAAMLSRGGLVRGQPGVTRPLARQTVRLVHRVLYTALRRAKRRRMIATNPAEDATPPGAPPVGRVRAFTTDQVQALLKAAAATDPELHCIVAVLLATGARRSEVLALAADNVDFDAATITIAATVVEVGGRPVEQKRGKSRASLRTIAIPMALVEILRAQRARVNERALAWGPTYRRTPMLLFAAPDGGPMPPPMLTKRLKALMRSVGLKDQKPCHGWRHTAGSLLYDATRNVKLVQKRLGHAESRTTIDLYVHEVEGRDREAAEIFGDMLKR
jgi:integrase